MTRIEFENLKENDRVFIDGNFYSVTGWYNNQLVEVKELVYNVEKDEYEITNNMRRFHYYDLKDYFVV